MTEVSDFTAKKARKTQTALLQALAERSQTRVADLMGVSESKVSRLKSEQLAEIAAFIAACGLKVVPETAQTYDEDYIKSLKHLAGLGLNAPAPVWGDE